MEIEKIMTLSAGEFANSIRQFAGEAAAEQFRREEKVVLPLGEGQAAIGFVRIDGFSFGGLVDMPRARVVLTLTGCSPADQAAFLRRFDIAFQRGGG